MTTDKTRTPVLLCSAVLLVAGVALLAGCGEQGGKTAASKLMEAPQHYTKAVRLEGTVSDNTGPVQSGTVKAMTPGGQLIAETTLANSHRYSLEIPAGTALPLLLSVEPNGGDKLLCAVVHAGISKYDINPSSTAIAKQAKTLGGYTHANLVRAAESMVAVPDANKTTSGFRGDPTTQYGGWH